MKSEGRLQSPEVISLSKSKERSYGTEIKEIVRLHFFTVYFLLSSVSLVSTQK